MFTLSEKHNQICNIFVNTRIKRRIKKSVTSSTLWAIPFCTGPESLGGVTATSTFAPFSVASSIDKRGKTTDRILNYKYISEIAVIY